MQKEIITGFVILLTLTMITIPVYGVRTWEEIYKEKSTEELYKEKESIQKSRTFKLFFIKEWRI